MTATATCHMANIAPHATRHMLSHATSLLAMLATIHAGYATCVTTLADKRSFSPHTTLPLPLLMRADAGHVTPLLPRHMPHATLPRCCRLRRYAISPHVIIATRQATCYYRHMPDADAAMTTSPHATCQYRYMLIHCDKVTP
jgi:hypothetical protein